MKHSYGAVIYIDNNGQREFLLIQNKKGKHWDYPKGTPEGNETPKETAIREIKEEVGLDVTFKPKFTATINYFLPEGDIKYVTYYLAEVNLKEIIPEVAEVIDYGWFGYDEAKQKVTFDNAKYVLEKANYFLQ